MTARRCYAGTDAENPEAARRWLSDSRPGLGGGLGLLRRLGLLRLGLLAACFGRGGLPCGLGVPGCVLRGPAFLARLGVLVLLGPLGGRLRPIEQLHERHGRVVAEAEAELEDAQVAAGPIRVARAQLAEELVDDRLVAQPIEGEPA